MKNPQVGSRFKLVLQQILNQNVFNKKCNFPVIFIHVIQCYTLWKGLKEKGNWSSCMCSETSWKILLFWGETTVDSLIVRKCINHIPCQSASWYNLVDIVTHFYASRACFCFHHDQVVTAFICVSPCDCNVTSLLLFTFVILKCHVTKDGSAFLNCWP